MPGGTAHSVQFSWTVSGAEADRSKPFQTLCVAQKPHGSWLVVSPLTSHKWTVCVPACPGVRSSVNHNVSNMPAVLSGSQPPAPPLHRRWHRRPWCPSRFSFALRLCQARCYTKPAGGCAWVHTRRLKKKKICLSLHISLASFHLDAVFPSVSIPASESPSARSLILHKSEQKASFLFPAKHGQLPGGTNSCFKWFYS